LASTLLGGEAQGMELAAHLALASCVGTLIGSERPTE
jgi:hypothetical protein